eukprot:jgi/Bigna1/66211/fgenesh1_pg.1_\
MDDMLLLLRNPLVKILLLLPSFLYDIRCVQAFVHTVPHIANTVYRNRGEHGSSAKGGSSSSGLSSSSSSSSSHYSSTHSPSGLQRGGSGMAGGDYSEEMMMAETPNGLETYVACVVISPDGKPRPQKLDQGVTIRASLSVGKEKNSSARRYEQVCTSKDRKMLVDCKNVITMPLLLPLIAPLEHWMSVLSLLCCWA